MEIAYSAVIINSYNGLTVGDNQLNNIGNDIDVIGAFNSPRSMPRSSFSRSSASANPVVINSFQGNIAGPNSFQNNAGISLVPTRRISTSNNSRVLLFSILISFA